jgi:tetratricopeptide (TPR) repeat protein
LALTEFVNKHFEKARELFEQSAQLTEAELRDQSGKLRAKVVNELRRDGDSSYNDYRFAEALESYQKALSKVKRESDPGLWAAMIDDVGRACGELGIRTKGPKAAEYLARAVAAYRSALGRICPTIGLRPRTTRAPH